MFRLTLRNISRRKLRYALTAFAVVLGVAFLSTSFFLTDQLRDSFDELSADIGSDQDLIVRAAVPQDADRSIRVPVPEQILEIVNTEVSGIKTVAPFIRAFNVQPIFINSDGESEAVTTFGAPQFGVNYYEAGKLTQYFIVEGRSPVWTGPIEDESVIGEFALDVDTASDNGFVIGNTYQISGPSGNKTFELVGTANWRSPDENKATGATISIFETETAQTFLNRNIPLGDFGEIGTFDEILIEVEEGVDIPTVQNSLQTLLNGFTDQFASNFLTLPEKQQDALTSYIDIQIEVVDSETITQENQDDFSQFIDILSNVLLAFAIIAVIVSAFIINNTFSIVLGQRVKELALLRALGATSRQVVQSVILEAVLIGVFASALGLVAGYGLALGGQELLESVGLGRDSGSLPIRSRTIIVAAVVGIGATVVSSIGPANRVRSIAPVEALRDQPGLTPTSLSRRLIGGVSIACIGVIMLLTSIFRESLSTAPQLTLLAAGALATFGGVYLLSPVATRPIANFLGLPIQKVFRMPGRLAKENASRRPRRTAATAAALTIGLALVSMAAVVSDSLKATIGKTLDTSISADLFISSQGSFGPPTGFSSDLVNDLRIAAEENPELIDSTINYRFAFSGMTVADDYKDVVSTDLSLLSQHMDIDVAEGSINAQVPDGSDGVLLLHSDPAETNNFAIGDQVPVKFGGTREANLTIAGIYNNATLLGNWVVDNSTFEKYLPQTQDFFLSVLFSPLANTDEALGLVTTFTDEYPQLAVESQTEYRESVEAQLDQVLRIITVFLGLSLLIAVLGITNTLALSVYEQTRELGLLRAIGMTRRQVRRMVRWEAVIIALFGGILGVAMGILFGLAATAAIDTSIVSELSIPVKSVIQYLLISAIFGIVAAILPAYRASRLKVLDAISHN